MTVNCPNCANEFERIGSHWSQSPNCDYPELTEHQMEVATGLLMGDGTMKRSGNGSKPRLFLGMISPNYLRYVDEQFGILGTGVSLYLTAEENAKENRDSGFRPNAQAENYSDLYVWRSRTHPEFEEFSEWYSTGEKVWPEEIELTPTVLKHWYCGDGYWDNSGTQNRIQIAMANEINNINKIDKLFNCADLPTPSNYAIGKRKDGSKTCAAQFTVSQSKELWEYMGEPLPDFEYKWPEEYRNSY